MRITDTFFHEDEKLYLLYLAFLAFYFDGKVVFVENEILKRIFYKLLL